MGVHFQYQGVHFELPDGTTPDVAKQKILAHLGQTAQPTTPAQEPITKPEESSVLKNVLLENPLTAVGEAGLSMLSGTPGFVASGISKAGALLSGKFTEEELNKAGEDIPEWTKKITYEPRSDMGKGANQLMGEGIKALGKGLAGPAALTIGPIKAAIKGTGQTGAREEVKKVFNDVSPITNALFEIGLVGKGVRDTQLGFKERAQARKDLDQLKRLEELKKQKQQPQQPTEGLPKLPEEQPLVPGTSGEEMMFPKQESTPLPAIPDELKPLSEQYPQEIPIGAIEEGGVWSNTPGSPKLEPPVLTRDLLSLEDQPLKGADVPDTQNLATRHDVPTDEFPLRQEVLQQPEIVDAINKFREEAATLEQQATNGSGFWKTQAEQKLTKLQDEFLAGMRQLGIDNPQEAVGLQKLYDSGKETKLPVEHTFQGKSPLGGVGKKQGGAVSFDFGKKKVPTPEEFKDRLEKLSGHAVDPEIARQMYDQRYPTETKAAKVKEAVSNIPGISEAEGFNKYESRPVLDDPLGEESVRRMEAVGTMDLDKPVSGAFKNLLSAGRMQSWSKKSPIVHEGTQFITSVKDTYRIAAAEAISSVNKLTLKMERSFAALGSSWRDAYDVFRIRRDHEFDPNFDPSTVLSGPKLELFKQIDSVVKDLWPKINERRKQLDPSAPDLPQLPYYFTSFFSGDWAIPVFDKNTGQFLFNIRETTRGAANKAKDWVNANPEFSARDVRLQKQTHYTNAKIDAASDFQTMVDTFGTSDPAALQAMQRLANSSNKSSFNTAGMPNRFLNKEGRVGSLGDKPWRTDKENYYDNKRAFERYVEGANEWLANTQISKFAENMQKSEAIDVPNAKAFIQDYADYVTGRKETSANTVNNLAASISHSMGGSGSAGITIARKWANVNTALFIGYYSARAGLQNSVQWLQATAPKLTQLQLNEGYNGSVPTAIVLGMFRGTRDAIGHWAGGDLDLATLKRVKHDSLAFKEANHVVDAHLVDSQGMWKNVWANTAYDLTANKSVAATEQLSRSVAFSIYQAYFESAGISKAKAMDMAKNLTHETMVNYESYAKPQVFGNTGPVGEMAGRLQTYKMNSVTQFYEYASKMKVADPKSWAPVGVSLGMNIALAGALGLIGMDVAELMWQGLQAADRSAGEQTPWIQENSVKRYIYENYNPHVSMGVLSTTLGVSASGAFAQNLVGDDPLKSIVPIFGGAIDQLAAPFRILGGSSDSSKAKGWGAIAPASAKPYIEEAFSTVEHPDGTKQVISPNTGKTSWSGPDQGYKTTAGLIHPLMTNLQTLERGQYAMDSKFHHEFNKDIKDSQKEIEDSVQNQVVDWYKAQIQGGTDERPRERLESKLMEYFKAGGDVDLLTQHISSQLEKLGARDEIINELSNEIQTARLKQAEHAVKTFNRR